MAAVSWSDLGIFLATLAATGVALYLTERAVHHTRRETHNDVAGYIFAVVGVMYAVFLGFMVVSVKGDIDAARQTTFTEADELGGLYWISRQLPLPIGAPLERDTLRYANLVTATEWPLMARHTSSEGATNLVYDMRDLVFRFQPADPGQQVLFDHAVTHVENLASARRARLNQIQEDVPPTLWVALIMGGVLTVAFSFLFGVSHTATHTLMVLILTALVVSSLLVIKEMDYPFSGPAQVQPTAFQVFLSRLPPPR